MHSSASQRGTSTAMLRFSKAVVPGGKLPSTGMALTGISSPRPAIILAVTLRTKIGASSGTSAGSSSPVQRLGHRDLVQVRQRRVDRGEVLLDHRAALAAVRLLDRGLDRGDRLVARQHAGDGEEAGLQDGVDARAEAEFLRHPGGVDDVELQLACR